MRRRDQVIESQRPEQDRSGRIAPDRPAGGGAPPTPRPTLLGNSGVGPWLRCPMPAVGLPSILRETAAAHLFCPPAGDAMGAATTAGEGGIGGWGTGRGWVLGFGGLAAPSEPPGREATQGGRAAQDRS